jgi:CelD/BcsL family acetyltransferase involved in cellulose biosynthesis
MHTHIYTTPDAFDQLAAEWNDVLARSSSKTLFLTNEWQKTWWRELGEGELRVLAMRDPSTGSGDALVGIAPLFFEANQLGGVEVALVGCKEVSDYLDFIFATGYEEACFREVIAYLKSGDAPEWHTIGLCNIIETSPTLSTFRDLLNAEGWNAHTSFEDVCPIVQLPDSFDAYLATLEGKERRELQRKLRRASEDVAITFAQDANKLDQDVDDFIALMMASMVSKSSFMTPRMNRFFHAAAKAMFQAGWLQLAFLEVEGVRAASYMNFVYDDAVLVYNSGLDPQKFSYLSPGQVLVARLIEQAIAEKRRAFDFLQGNEDYKYKLGGKDVKLFTLSARK